MKFRIEIEATAEKTKEEIEQDIRFWIEIEQSNPVHINNTKIKIIKNLGEIRDF